MFVYNNCFKCKSGYLSDDVLLITDFILSRSKSTFINEIENIDNFSLNVAVLGENIDEFSVSNTDIDVISLLPKERRILAVQTSEEEIKADF